MVSFALQGVADEFLSSYQGFLHRNRIARLRGRRRPKECIHRLLRRAMLSGLLVPRRDYERARQRRDALAYVLAAASVPQHLRPSGLPAEFQRARQSGRRRG